MHNIQNKAAMALMKFNGNNVERISSEETDDKGFHSSVSFSLPASDDGAQRFSHSKFMQPDKNRAQRRKEMHEQMKKAQRFTKRLNNFKRNK